MIGKTGITNAAIGGGIGLIGSSFFNSVSEGSQSRFGATLGGALGGLAFGSKRGIGSILRNRSFSNSPRRFTNNSIIGMGMASGAFIGGTVLASNQPKRY